MRIAIIDDLAADRASLREALTRELADRIPDASIEEFRSGEEFTAVFAPGRYAAAFIDIYMGKVSGMDVAKLLYRRDPNCRIIFLTTSREFMLESYAVHATYYLVKPFAEERLRQALDFCFPAPDPSDLLTVPTKTGVQLLSRRDIVCIESISRHGVVHLHDKTIDSTDTFADLTAPLAADTRFLLIGRGILLQLGHVAAQEGSDFIMDDGTRLPIARRSRSEVLRAFQDFALREMEK